MPRAYSRTPSSDSHGVSTMKSLFQRLRGAIGTTILWGLGWAATGAALVFAAARLLPGLFDEALLPFAWVAVAVSAGVVGAIAGSTFSILLSAMQKGRKVEELSVGGAAATGLLAGLLVPGAIVGVAAGAGVALDPTAVGVLLGALGLTGSVTAAGTIRIAKIALGGGGNPSGAIEAVDSPPSAIPSPTAAPTTRPPASDDIDDDALAEALKDDPEIARLLGDDP